jgi:hypothetical protein
MLATSCQAIIAHEAFHIGLMSEYGRGREKVGDLIVNRDEPLNMAGGFEQLHDRLLSPRRQM